MILRHAPDAKAGQEPEERKVEPAWKVFFSTQQRAASPEAVVLQAAHAALAGELASHLLPEAFGELRPEVIEAATRHDWGWAESDERQIATEPARKLKPFPEMKADELPSWRRSLELAEEWAPLTRVLISRHFCALANQPTPQHEEFITTETPRRVAIERTLSFGERDLKRWAGAVGLCDLLSLYLCCGTERPAWFPVAHPADSEAPTARRFTVACHSGELICSEPVFVPGAHVQVETLRLNAAGELIPVRTAWILRVRG